MRVYARVCVCACVRACVRACVLRACVRACVWARSFVFVRECVGVFRWGASTCTVACVHMHVHRYLYQ